ncbi:chemotaxis protein CheD [Anaerovorax odorimutans]|uniref:Probable chemoreceptor glutamine deamidase CheD n=1 Tax=Anaerovorax odorimutans TaxID=109327 RepID=A0ABT1RP19_9FIRM|nr:chemotaxis protein CheD [Anaerovorax odorimutans]MCQ4636936.1 chemotaxis protein CheD [Anaerovorax odorimutans]
MKQITVGLAEGKIAEENQFLISYALGSCVGVCLYDKERKIAGMAHIILPGKMESRDQTNPYKFADEGVKALIRDMKRHGAKESQLIAKIAGGAKMFSVPGWEWEIGERNIKAVKKALSERAIRIAAEDTGKNYGRTISFFADDGRLEVKSIKQQLRIL